MSTDADVSSGLHTLTLAQMQAKMIAGDVSSRELTDHSLQRIEALNGDLNAILRPMPPMPNARLEKRGP